MRSWRADSLCLRRARSRNYPMLQKSPRRSCRIKIRNNRIGANGFLNQRCALTPDLESILRTQTGKILLQQNLPGWAVQEGRIEPNGVHQRLRNAGPWAGARWGCKLRLHSSRSRGKSALVVIGGCLAVYAAFAVVFHSFIEPAVKTQAVAPYEPSART